MPLVEERRTDTGTVEGPNPLPTTLSVCPPAVSNADAGATEMIPTTAGAGHCIDTVDAVGSVADVLTPMGMTGSIHRATVHSMVVSLHVNTEQGVGVGAGSDDGKVCCMSELASVAHTATTDTRGHIHTPNADPVIVTTPPVVGSVCGLTAVTVGAGKPTPPGRGVHTLRMDTWKLVPTPGGRTQVTADDPNVVMNDPVVAHGGV